MFTDFAERLTKLPEVFVGYATGKPEPVRTALKRCWLSQNHRGQVVFHFEGVNSINDAERFRGLEVLLPFEQRVKLPTGQYFVTDLVGCRVFEIPSLAPAVSSSPGSLLEAPALLGKVREVQFPGEEFAGTPLLEVDTGHGELLIPLAEDICTRIDIAAKRIEVSLPEGLRDLD